jgi:hypothetical protein
MINLGKEQPSDPAAAAKREVVRLFEAERGLEKKRREALAALESVEKGSAAAAADGDFPETAARTIVQARSEISILEQSIEITRQRRLAAIQKQYNTEAGEMRAAARGKREEADSIARRCEPFLRKLSDLQGVAFDHSILLAQRNGHWLGSFATGAPVDECNPLEAQPDIGAAFMVPRSRALLGEAKNLEQKAAALDLREVHSSYSLTKPTLSAIIDSEEFLNPEALTPAVFTIERWAAAVEGKVRRERPDLLWGEREIAGGAVGDFVPRPRRYRISWSDGKLDPDNSSLSFPGASSIFNDPTFTAEVLR